MKKMRTLFVIAVVTLLLASVALVTPARSAPAAQGGGAGGFASSPALTTEAASATAAYWTSARMAAAIPMEMNITASAVKGSVPAPATLAPAGVPGAVPGHGPGQPAAGEIGPATLASQGISPAAAVVVWYSYPFPYTRSYIGGAWPTYYPMRTNGKLFFSRGGGNYVCSGTVVTSATGGSNRLVDTAGHCVNDGAGTWSTNVLFCPAFSGGAVGPWGCWTALQYWTFGAWASGGDLRYDQGYIITANTSTTGAGRIESTVGAQGFAWNQSYVQEFWSWGYPAGAPYDGTALVLTTSSTAEADDPGGGFPYTIGIGSDETGGSSGGGWIIWARLGNYGYLNSHNDYKYIVPSRPLAMYGPYYGQWTHDLWDYVRVLFP